jgi:membrane protease YdiL (CAAX protease family)
VPDWEEIRVSLLAWLILALLSAGPALGFGFGAGRGWPFRDRRLFPRQRTRLAPWSGLEVCVLFFFTQLLVPAFLYLILHRAGFFNWLYGPGFEPPPGAADHELADARRGLWVSAFAFPFQLTGMLIIVRRFSGTGLYQLGLTTWNAGRNMVIGWLAWLLLTPAILILHVLAVWGYWVWEGTPPEEHPLARLARAEPLGIEWILIVLSSVFMAPVLEEVLFRRLLQGWASGRPWGAPIILVAAFALTFGKWLGNLVDTWDKTSLGSALRDLEPTVFVLVLAPGCFFAERLARRWLSQPYAAQAIYSTALLFAVFHVWPTPLPLFVLGLALGYIAYRTQNLLAPIVFHALFNGVACMIMLLT